MSLWSWLTRREGRADAALDRAEHYSRERAEAMGSPQLAEPEQFPEGGYGYPARPPLAEAQLDRLEQHARGELRQSAQIWMAHIREHDTGFRPQEPASQPHYRGHTIPAHLERMVLDLAEKEDRRMTAHNRTLSLREDRDRDDR